MKTRIVFKETALERVVRFLQSVPKQPILTEHPFADRSLQCFLDAPKALLERHKNGCFAPSATIGYFDDETSLQVFDTIEKGFWSYQCYKEVETPVVFLTLGSLQEIEDDYEDDGEGTDEP